MDCLHRLSSLSLDIQHILNFLDIEAAVDNDEDDSSEYETDDLGMLLQFDKA
jgi:hypothetical protein